MAKEKDLASIRKNFVLLSTKLLPNLAEADSPLAVNELKRLELNLRNLRHLHGREERVYLGGHLRTAYGEKYSKEYLYRQLELGILETHKFLNWLLSEYLPESYRSVFASEGRVGATTSFRDLLLLWDENRYKQELLAIQREFEARRTIALGFMFLELLLLGVDVRLSGKVQASLTQFLENSFFENSESQIRILLYFQDPKDDSRIKHWQWADNKELVPDKFLRLVRRNKRLICRVFSWREKQYLICLEDREKNPFSHVLKMLKENDRNPNMALDQIGYKLIFFSEESLKAAIEKLLEIFPLPGICNEYNDSISASNYKGTSRSDYSSAKWRSIKSFKRFSGFWIEEILELIDDHLNATLSVGEETHEFYKLRPLLEKLLALLFPVEIYGVDWSSAAVRRDLVNYHKAKIK